ncbi:MAG: dUTPase [Epsilonproteobacteria bacterium]|nr:dUTPase [Campylobacterota bacterium]
MEKILLMLQLQNQLNNATNGEEWVKGITKNNKQINWRRCIYMESAEMIDCFAWKHWKNIEAEPDWDNLKIEIVDVWHFIMSLAIEYYHQQMKGGVEDIALVINEMPSFNKLLESNDDMAQPDEVMAKVEDIMRDVLSQTELDLEKLFDDFFALVTMGGLDLTTLYTLYIGKNILNTFRQDNGYKEGTYIKSWNGEEDNVYMQKILEDNPDIKPQTLYKELTKIYHQVNELG